MGTISSGVGLFSGLDYASLVDQLIAIDARPVNQLTTRINDLDAQRTAWMDLSARISALLSRVNSLTSRSIFQSAAATSSNPSVLGVTAGSGAMPGAYSFIVRSLATTHQLVSRGFADPDAPVGPGTFTIESAAAKVNRETALEELNGFTGVTRGAIRLVDGAGNEATVDLHDAQTIGDVIDRINDADVGVRADLRGEALVLSDTTGGGLGVRIREVDDGHTAADLGFSTGNTYSPDGELVGSDLVYLSELTPLSALNDGLGIRTAKAGTDFTIQSSNPAVTVDVRLNAIITDQTRLERLNHARGVELGTIRITTKNGVSTEVDLSTATTVGEVKQRIEDAVDGVTIVMSSGRLLISDTTDGDSGDFIVEDVTGHAARDLGIAGSTSGDKITGRQVLFMDTVADVLAAINYGAGNLLEGDTPVIEASISEDGRRLVITDHGGGSFPAMVITPEADTGAQTLADLGFEAGTYGTSATGGRILGGLNTVLLKTLNGGQGVTGGTISISAGGTALVDLSQAETLRDVVDLINQAAQEQGLSIEAGYDRTGTRLQIVNTAEDGTPITISDVDGDFAQSVGLAGTGASLTSNNLQRQYFSENTSLDKLNLGNGVSLGTIRITDSQGHTEELNLAAEGAETLGDVIEAINALDAVQVEARINDTGDGLLIVDQAGGTGTLKIEDTDGTAARDLNLLGESEGDPAQIDGSFEFKIDGAEAGTLSGLVDQINATTLASAHLLNDGSPAAPYRLTVASQATGRDGELIIDEGDTGLDFSTLVSAQNAVVTLGSDAGGLVLTSSSNTLTDVVPGLTLTLSGVDDEPVNVTVERDLDTLIDVLEGIAEDYNDILDRMDEVGSYDPETETRGILFADSTLQTIETRLFRAFSGSVPGATGRFTRLSELGLQFESGGKLGFDEEKFREAYQEDPEAVMAFFTDAESGVAFQLKETLKRITETGGLIDRQENALQDQKDLLSERVDQLNELLEIKRERLLRQFQAMEQALAQLQAQQSAISGISTLTLPGSSTGSQSGR